MARPTRSDPVVSGIGAAVGVMAGGPLGAALGGLLGAAISSSKYTLEASIEKALQERGLESRAIRWATKRQVEVAYSAPGGAIKVAQMAAPAALTDPEAIADALYDGFVSTLGG